MNCDRCVLFCCALQVGSAIQLQAYRMAAEDFQSPSRFCVDRKLRIGPSVRPSPVFKAVERLSLSQELRIYIGAKNRKCDILHGPSYGTASLLKESREGESVIKNVENLFSFPFPSSPTQNTSGC